MRRLITILLILTAMWLRAERTDSLRTMWGADVRPAWLIPTCKYYRGDNDLNQHPFGALSGTLKAALRFAPGSEGYRNYRDTYQGLAVGYTDFFHRSLIGRPVSVYLFQGFPVKRLSPRLGLYAEWEFGASFGWHTQRYPDPAKPAVNGSATTARLAINLAMRYRLSSTAELVAAFDLTHFSNGNTRFPNAGTNLAGLRLGVAVTPGNLSIPDGTIFDSYGPQQKSWSWDLLLYGAAHKKFYHNDEDVAIPLKGAYAVAGATFGPMKEYLGGLLRAGATLDLQWDRSADMERYSADDSIKGHIYTRMPPAWRQLSVGASIHGEIVLPYFAINVGIGRNIWSPAPDQRVFYQTLALRTMITRRLFLNIGYSLRNFAHPRTLMIGLGFRFGTPSAAPSLFGD